MRSPNTWTPQSRFLPVSCKRALDAEGQVHGRTWRDMPGGLSASQESKALERVRSQEPPLPEKPVKLNRAQRAKRDALRAIMEEEALS